MYQLVHRKVVLCIKHVFDDAFNQLLLMCLMIIT
jgi:hypothetical protein